MMIKHACYKVNLAHFIFNQSAISAMLLMAALGVLLPGCTSEMPAGLDDRQSQESIVLHDCPGDGSVCQAAIEGSRNIDIFSELNKSMVKSELVEYSQVNIGYLARPLAEGVFPGVVMIHEWWGLNDNIKDMADLLAQEGYIVLAVDLYDGEVANSSERAGRLAGAVRSEQARAITNMRAAASYLKQLQSVQPKKVASLGWCFGGGESLELALSGEELGATIIYYGSLVNSSSVLSAVTWPVLGIFGGLDSSIPASSVEAFKSALDEAGVENQIIIYPGVGHAFANPSGARYAPAETRDAWDKTIMFLDYALKE
jgi:carboxymethylenebutenolidase